MSAVPLFFPGVRKESAGWRQSMNPDGLACVWFLCALFSRKALVPTLPHLVFEQLCETVQPTFHAFTLTELPLWNSARALILFQSAVLKSSATSTAVKSCCWTYYSSFCFPTLPTFLLPCTPPTLEDLNPPQLLISWVSLTKLRNLFQPLSSHLSNENKYKL